LFSLLDFFKHEIDSLRNKYNKVLHLKKSYKSVLRKKIDGFQGLISKPFVLFCITFEQAFQTVDCFTLNLFI